MTRARFAQTLYVFLIIGVLGVVIGLIAIVAEPNPAVSVATKLEGLVALLLAPSAVWLILAPK